MSKIWIFWPIFLFLTKNSIVAHNLLTKFRFLTTKFLFIGISVLTKISIIDQKFYFCPMFSFLNRSFIFWPFLQQISDNRRVLQYNCYSHKMIVIERTISVKSCTETLSRKWLNLGPIKLKLVLFSGFSPGRKIPKRCSKILGLNARFQKYNLSNRKKVVQKKYVLGKCQSFNYYVRFGNYRKLDRTVAKHLWIVSETFFLRNIQHDFFFKIEMFS